MRLSCNFVNVDTKVINAYVCTNMAASHKIQITTTAL